MYLQLDEKEVDRRKQKPTLYPEWQLTQASPNLRHFPLKRCENILFFLLKPSLANYFFIHAVNRLETWKHITCKSAEEEDVDPLLQEDKE